MCSFVSFFLSQPVYQKDTDLIPKNARVQINRVVRNIGPAIAGGTILSTHKDHEQLADFRLKQQKLHEKLAKNAKTEDDSPHEDDYDHKHNIKAQYSPASAASPFASSQELAATTNRHGTASIYADLLNAHDENSSHSNSNSYGAALLGDEKVGEVALKKAVTNALPPVELLCPFEDLVKHERHLMKNAVIAPCCGYFICCEDCKLPNLFSFNNLIRPKKLNRRSS